VSSCSDSPFEGFKVHTTLFEGYTHEGNTLACLLALEGKEAVIIYFVLFNFIFFNSARSNLGFKRLCPYFHVKW
jgi:hypothetical protein